MNIFIYVCDIICLLSMQQQHRPFIYIAIFIFKCHEFLMSNFMYIMCVQSFIETLNY